MKINPDIVPINLEEALKTLKEGLTTADFEEIKHPDFDGMRVHGTVGMRLRNDWSLWEKDTILVKWFKENYGLDHADDISTLILDCLAHDIQGKPRRDKAMAKRLIDNWKK